VREVEARYACSSPWCWGALPPRPPEDRREEAKTQTLNCPPNRGRSTVPVGGGPWYQWGEACTCWGEACTCWGEGCTHWASQRESLARFCRSPKASKFSLSRASAAR
jgi:hypothetical protein